VSESAAKILGEALSNALRAECEKPIVGSYRPSLLPCCLKRQYLIYKRGLDVPEEKAGIFQIGRMFHNFVQKTLSNSFTVKSVEAPFFITLLSGDQLFRIAGKADLIVEIENKEYIIEAKSIRRLPDQPLKHHVEQLIIYLGGYYIENGFLIYLEKNALQHRIFPVEFDLGVFRRMIGRAAILHRHLVSGEEPKPDPDKWECRYCEFRSECTVGSQR
jgi:CRISPR/Cas system-associated exonuclease Cas4 (RecB family)